MRGHRHHHQAQAPLRPGDFIEHISEPVTFGTGLDLRRARCLLCGMAASALPVRIVMVVPADQQPCTCGLVDVAGGIICADHHLPPAGDLTHRFADIADRAARLEHRC